MERAIRERAGATLLLVLAIGLMAPPSAARDLFRSRIKIDGIALPQLIEVESARDVTDVVGVFVGLLALAPLPPGTPVPSLGALFDLRGLRADISFGADSSQLDLEMKRAGLKISFDGGSREASLEQLEDWFSGDFESPTAPSGALTDMLQALVEYSPVDPVAGNPNSLQTRMFDADYRLGSEGPFLAGATLPGAEDLFGIDAEVASTDSGPFEVLRAELPLSYRVNLGAPWVSLLFDLPLIVTETEGQLAGMGSFGLGLQLRPFAWWSLTPLARVGVVGSLDVGAGAVLYHGSLTSRITIPLGDFELGISNQLGYSRTYDDVSVSGLRLEYDLTNGISRNGGSISGPLGFSIGETPIGFEVFGSDTRFFGDDLFLDSQGEVGGAVVAFGEIAGFRYQSVHLGAAWVFGDDTDSVRAELRLRF